MPAHRKSLALVALALIASFISGCETKGKDSASSSVSGNATKESAATSANFTSSPSGIAFADVTENSQLKHVYRNGEESGVYSIVESLGGGVGLLDINLDGMVDLCFPGGGEMPFQQPPKGLPNALWIQTTAGKYQEVSEKAFLHHSNSYTHGCAIGDFDNDGFSDIVITGYNQLQYFKGMGDGTFTECSQEVGLVDKSWSTSAACGDFNGDGDLDLYIAHYVDWSWQNPKKCPGPKEGEFDICSPHDFSGLNDLLFFSNGDGTFRVSDESTGLAKNGKGLGVIALDIDLDHQLDVYVANDTTNNFLLHNQGEGKFKDIGLISGTAFDDRGIPNGSMGVASLDFNRDLRPDIWVTNYENETFAMYQNEGAADFTCITERTGINALGTLYVGFGTVSLDLELDGDEDLVVANGHVMRHPKYSTSDQEQLILLNRGNGRLQRIKDENSPYFSAKHRGRGVASWDMDLDGDLDCLFTNVNQPISLQENRTPKQGNWLQLDLIGTKSNRNAIGAWVILETDKGKLFRMVTGGGSYLSQGPYRIHFGIPRGETLQSLKITWPDGATQVLGALAVNSLHAVVQP